MTTRPTPDFVAMLEQSGVPTTEDGIETALKTEVIKAGSLITNTSAMSPFWRLIRAVVTAPVLWLIKTLLAGHILPASYAATASGYYLDLKAWEVGLERKDVVKTRGLITFTKTNAATAVTVPALTVIQTERIDGVIYRVMTLDDTVIAAGTESATIEVEAEGAGAAWNLPAGYYTILPVSVAGIASARNVGDWITQSGADEEDSESLALRIRNQFSTVGRYHIDAVYRSMLAEQAGVKTSNIYFEHDAPRGPGTANAYVLMDVGDTPQSLIDGLNKYVRDDGHHGHGDDLLVKAFPTLPVSLTAQVVCVDNLSLTQQQELAVQVEQRIRAAFRESAGYEAITRALPNSRFSISNMAKELHEQLPHLRSIAFNRGDVVSGLAVPKLTSISVGVM